MGTTRVIRPGRADMTTTLVERNTASGMEWVTKMTVVPVAALHYGYLVEMDVIAALRGS